MFYANGPKLWAIITKTPYLMFISTSEHWKTSNSMYLFYIIDILLTTHAHISSEHWALSNTAVKCLNKFEWDSWAQVHDRYIFTIDRWTMCVLQKCMQSETFGFFKQILYSINFLYQLHKRDRRVRKNCIFNIIY